MLTQYQLLLSCETAVPPQAEWAYRLYAALLDRAPEGFGGLVHQDAHTPVSQFLRVREGGSLLWTVNLLGETCEAALSGPLEALDRLRLDVQTELSVRERRKRRIGDADTLFSLAERGGQLHRLAFCTPTAFKSRKRYQNLPTTRLLLQSLIRKWNSCIPDRPMPETEDEALEELAADLVCRSFQLQDSTFFLKGNAIPGFTGSILFENRLTGAQGLRVDALLHFAPFSGVGIKTALGMGGVARIPR